MKATDFRTTLRRKLEDCSDEVLLWVLSTPGTDPAEFTGGGLLERSIAAADQYSRAPERSVVLLLLPHSVELFLLHLGLLLTGRVPAILAWPTSRIDPEKYQRNLLHQLQNLPASELITLPSLARNLEPALPYPVRPVPCAAGQDLDRVFDLGFSTTGQGKTPIASKTGGAPEEAAFLQFSGGTTGQQKCVVVTGSMLEMQLTRLARTLCFRQDDSVVSWLPLYHDMGLIACFWLPLWTGAPSLQIGAQDWLMDPGLLFRFVERFRGTFCWLPNFAFSYLAAQRERMRSSDVRHVRAWVNCSEPVRRRSIDAFVSAFSSWGVTREQCQASYAMAENVFAVTQTVLGSVPPTVSRSTLHGQSLGAKQLSFGLVDEVYVSSGVPLEDMKVRIRRPDGGLCGDLEPGGIEIHTPCMFSGYWGTEGFRTTTLAADGWYVTGDYGFTSCSELYVIGRTNDIVIVGGQNIFPEDIEVLANSVAGVYPGRIVAFGVDDAEQGTETLVVIAEMRGEFDPTEAKRIEREISRTVLSGVGVAPRKVRVTPERWIVKSTAGKISRRETRARFMEENAPAPGSGRPKIK